MAVDCCAYGGFDDGIGGPKGVENCMSRERCYQHGLENHSGGERVARLNLKLEWEGGEIGS